MRISLMLGLVIFSLNALSQKCSCVVGKKNKRAGMKISYGLITSNDFYKLFIQKVIYVKDKELSPQYSFFLDAKTTVPISDSLLATKGTIELNLSDSSVITLNEVKYFKNYYFNRCCVSGFDVIINEEKIRTILKSPIVSLIVKDFFTTKFSEKKFKEQSCVAECLLLKK